PPARAGEDDGVVALHAPEVGEVEDVVRGAHDQGIELLLGHERPDAIELRVVSRPAHTAPQGTGPPRRTSRPMPPSGKGPQMTSTPVSTSSGNSRSRIRIDPASSTSLANVSAGRANSIGCAAASPSTSASPSPPSRIRRPM